MMYPIDALDDKELLSQYELVEVENAMKRLWTSGRISAKEDAKLRAYGIHSVLGFLVGINAELEHSTVH